MQPNAVGLKATCPHCHEEVELIVTKKQIKAIFKAFKLQNPTLAELETEKFIHLDNKGRVITK